MKRILPLLALPTLGLALIAFWPSFNSQPEASYSQKEIRPMDRKSRNWQLARERYASVLYNKQTGTIDQADIAAVEKDLSRMRGSRSLGVQWAEMGPDNIGGRTRAILVDKANSSRVYAGGVSGGLFYSDNAGGIWQAHPDINTNYIVSCIVQAPNGDIYIGTGNNFENRGTVLFPGGGIYKSTNGGLNFSILPSTKPASLGLTVDWAAVNKLVMLPGQSDYLYAGTNRGLKVSSDGGLTWSDGLKVNNCQLNAPGTVQDLEITTDGRLMVVFPNGVYFSDTPTNACSFAAITSGLPTSWGRMEIAIAPSDNARMYALTCTQAMEAFENIYISNDKGLTWTAQNPGPDISAPDFDMFGEANLVTNTGQGIYNMALAVDPVDQDRFFMAGVQMYRYDGNWIRATSEAFSLSSQFYVHADKHTIVFDPNNPSVMYVGTDGGVFKSNDRGVTYFAANRGFRITQFYGIGFSSTGLVLGGTQDNGSLALNPHSQSTPMDATQVLGADGFDCDFSQITGASFATVYFSEVYRSNGASGYSPILENAGGPFFTVLKLWEDANDLTSKDSIAFTVEENQVGVGTGNGIVFNFSGKVNPDQASGEVVPGSLRLKAGALELRDANGDGQVDAGSDGSGTFVYQPDGSVDFTVAFSQPLAVNLIVDALFNTHFDAGDTLFFLSETANIPIVEVLTAPLDSGDVHMVQDPVQSIVAVSSGNGVGITRGGLRFGEIPDWVSLTTGAPVWGGQATCFEFTHDGNHLFVGSSNGNVYRFSGLNNVYELADLASELTITEIFRGSGGQTVTGIALDPDDQTRMVVTRGNYGNTDYVHLVPSVITRTNSALANVTSVQANLPKMPIYDAEFIKGYNGVVLLGTEYGIFSINDIMDTSQGWQDESGNLPTCPVYDIRQQTLDYTKASNHGVIYVGTHGRGIWRSGFFVSTPEQVNLASNESVSSFVVYPNPMQGEGYVRLSVDKNQDAQIGIFDLQGRMVRKWSLAQLSTGENNLSLPIDELAGGTYVVALKGENWTKSKKFMIIK